tara:strand:+ start:458 stop:580 length:123 start_codon:yes stop_codon:yes gene_type:complete
MSTDLSTGELPTDMRLDELLFHGALFIASSGPPATLGWAE